MNRSIRCAAVTLNQFLWGGFENKICGGCGGSGQYIHGVEKEDVALVVL